MSRELVCLGVLAVAGAALLAAAVITARRPESVPDRSSYLDRWQQLHGGYDPRTGSVGVLGLLTLVHAVSRPLARRGVAPDLVTLASAWVAGLAVVLADLGGHWWVAAGLVLALSGIADNVDGCVAVLQDRVTAWGYVLDSAVDRVCDAAYLVAAVLAGCPVWLAAAVGFAVFLLEYVRARAGNAGGDAVGRVTMAERPTRVLLLAPTLVAAGVWPAAADVLSVVGPAVLLAMTVVATGQLLLTVHRQLTGR